MRAPLHNRGPALDTFRLAAAVLVTAIHTSPLAGVSPLADFLLTRVLARVAVPFFLMVSGYFLARRGWQGLGRFIRHNMLVYLAAAALYLPLNFYAGDSPVAWLRSLVWEGTFYHLWYFPALLWGVLIARGLAKLGPRAGVAAAGLLYLAGQSRSMASNRSVSPFIRPMPQNCAFRYSRTGSPCT